MEERFLAINSMQEANGGQLLGNGSITGCEVGGVALAAGLSSKPFTFRKIFTNRALIAFVVWAWSQSALTQQRKAA